MKEPVSQPSQLLAASAARRNIVVPLLAAVLVMLVFVTLPPTPTDLDADPDTSLSAVLNYAQQHGLQFGTDLVYTYGPLGYLIFFYYHPNAAVMRMMVDIVLCLTIAVGLCLVAWRLRLLWRCLLLAAFIFATANLPQRTDLVINTGFLCWGLLCFVESGRRLFFCVGTFVALAVFGAVAKTSVAFMGVLSVCLVAGSLATRGEWRLGIGMVGSFFVGIALMWMTAGQNLWHLGPFVVNALSLVQGYNHALGYGGPPQLVRHSIVLLLAGMVTVAVRAWNAFEGEGRCVVWRRGLFLAWACALLFLAWKHGFVRADCGHMVHFLGFVPLIMLALEALPCEARISRRWARGLATGASILALIDLQSWFLMAASKSLTQPFRAFRSNVGCLLSPSQYMRHMNEVIEANRRKARLPRLCEIVGRASVDVFGQRQVYALLNGLNYRPRPVFQSYAACNAQLMRLNEEFYLSGSAPQYVMFSLERFDHRFPPLADAMLLRLLLSNYVPAGSERDYVLLRAKSAQRPLLKSLHEGAVRAGDRIELGAFAGADLWLEIELKPTRLGRLRELLYQPPTVRLAAWRAGSGDLLMRRRAPAAMLAAGFVAHPLLLQTEDMLSPRSDEPARLAGAFSVDLPPGTERFWQSTIRFRVFQIELAADSR